MATSVYRDIYRKVNGIYNRYNKINSTYQPGKFTYEDWKGPSQFNTQATERVDSDIAAKTQQYQAQRQGVNANAKMAAQQIQAQRDAAQRALNQENQQSQGRLQAMMANTGMGAGQGSLENVGNLEQVYADRSGQMRNEFGLKMAENEMARGQSLNDIQAQEGAVRGARAAEIGRTIDTLSDADFQRYNAMRQQKFAEWGVEEQQRYQAALDQLSNEYNKLQGQMNVLDFQGQLTQDERDYLFNQYWKNKEFAYTSMQDKLNRKYNQSIANQNYNLNARQLQAQMDAQNALMRSLGL